VRVLLPDPQDSREDNPEPLRPQTPVAAHKTSAKVI